MSGYDNYERLSEFIETMRKHGIHTSIDDFGTGYSSLNLLTDLNVDVVKLDRSFANRLDKTNSFFSPHKYLYKFTILTANRLLLYLTVFSCSITPHSTLKTPHL